MRRAVARGRMFPQSYSTDRRYGRLSLKAIGLFPLMWSNADDQGRLCGNSEEIKYAVCPNIDHITKLDIPDLLQELQDNKLIFRYDTPKSEAIQMLDWWDANQKMQWAWPSDYQPPPGWLDHLRFKKGAKEVVTKNWPISGEDSGERSGEDNIVAQVNGEESSGERSGETATISQVSKEESSGERSGETSKSSPLTTPFPKKERGKGKRKRRGRGNSPEQHSASQVSNNIGSGENTSPSPTTDTSQILKELSQCFKIEWGRVPAQEPDKVIPRKLGARELAQLRDLAKELSARGGVPLGYIKQAFGEAAGVQKFHISYTRAVLLDWLGLPRSFP